MLSEEDIKQAFENNFDCYADGDIDTPAITKEQFLIVVKDLLAQPVPVKPVQDEKDYKPPVNLDVLIGIIAKNMAYHLPAYSIKAGKEIFEYLQRSSLPPAPVKPVGDVEFVYEREKFKDFMERDILELVPYSVEELQEQYINLLTEELNTVVGMAAVHGWRSTNVEAGKKLREQIAKAKEENVKQVEGETITGVEEAAKLPLIELIDIRNKLYEAIPTGEMNTWSLIQIIQWHCNDLDNYMSRWQAQQANNQNPQQ